MADDTEHRIPFDREVEMEAWRKLLAERIFLILRARDALETALEKATTPHECLMTVMDGLQALGIRPDVLGPLWEIAGGRIDALEASERASKGIGGNVRPINETLALAYGAATVTALKEHGHSMGDALRRTADAMGIDQKRIRNYRQNVGGRALGSELARKTYDDYLAELRSLSADTFQAEALRRIKGIGRFC
jgi:hypothetical protein